MRKETDYIGDLEIPDNALYGIHALRAKTNFPDTTPFYIEWYKAMGLVKLACYETCKNFSHALAAKYNMQQLSFKTLDAHIAGALAQAATEVSNGAHFHAFIVPAIQGGAGTSINMNVNEILTNRALELMGKKYGEYQFIDPIEHANIYQSTNDVVPTALKLAVMRLLTELEAAINALRLVVEHLEKTHRNTLRIGYTQMQQAVPTSYGRLFGTYNEALSRDWWRVSKCYERIKIINLGGSAIGTGIAVPRYFLMEVSQTLQQIAQLPLARSENMCDTTANLDSFVEAHAILKAHAVNLEKIVNDMRLLASDVSHGEIAIPQIQVGSSIMPGKVNPVIAEFVVSAVHKIYANDNIISSLCAQGCLELNAYMPVIGHAFIDSLKLLIAANSTLRQNMFANLAINTTKAGEALLYSASIATTLIPYIGYNKAAALASYMKQHASTIYEANDVLKHMDAAKLNELLLPENLLREGFSVNDTI